MLYGEIYDEMGYSLDDIESHIRRRALNQSIARRYAQMVEDELQLEQELLEQYPELASAVHALNMQEIAVRQQGVASAIGNEQGRSHRKGIKLFPGL